MLLGMLDLAVFEGMGGEARLVMVVVVVVVVMVVVILVEVERVGRRGGVGRARVQLGGGNGVEMLDMIGVGCGG